jgi:hypothetical protein
MSATFEIAPSFPSLLAEETIITSFKWIEIPRAGQIVPPVLKIPDQGVRI